VDLVAYLSQKYGSGVAKQVLSPDNPVARAGRPHGIVFNPARRVVNTIDSHQLLEFATKARGQEISNKLVEVLFRSYFQEAKDISDHEVLVACAVEVGLNESEVRNVLQNEAGQKDILKLDQEVKFHLKVSGVPHFVFRREDGRGHAITLSGAQPPEVFAEVFAELAAQQ